MRWWWKKRRPERMQVTRLVVESSPVPGTPDRDTEEMEIDPRLVTRIQDLIPAELPERFRTWAKSPTRILFATGNSIVVRDSSDYLIENGLGPPGSRSSRAMPRDVGPA